MPKVTYQKARKDYPDHGIAKGDMYYSWQFRFGTKQMSKTRPRPSQLTNSKMSGVYAAQESMEDAIAAASCLEDITSALTDCADEVRTVADEYREAKENMPDSLQESPVAQDCEEKADAIEAYADDLESAIPEIESLEIEDFDGDEDAMLEEAKSIAMGVELGV